MPTRRAHRRPPSAPTHATHIVPGFNDLRNLPQRAADATRVGAALAGSVAVVVLAVVFIWFGTCPPRRCPRRAVRLLRLPFAGVAAVVRSVATFVSSEGAPARVWAAARERWLLRDLPPLIEPDDADTTTGAAVDGAAGEMGGEAPRPTKSTLRRRKRRAAADAAADAAAPTAGDWPVRPGDDSPHSGGTMGAPRTPLPPWWLVAHPLDDRLLVPAADVPAILQDFERGAEGARGGAPAPAPIANGGQGGSGADAAHVYPTTGGRREGGLGGEGAGVLPRSAGVRRACSANSDGGDGEAADGARPLQPRLRPSPLLLPASPAYDGASATRGDAYASHGAPLGGERDAGSRRGATVSPSPLPAAAATSAAVRASAGTGNGTRSAVGSGGAGSSNAGQRGAQYTGSSR